jgi:tellurite resistance protein TerC
MTSLGWALTLAAIAPLLALDLVVSARRSGSIGLRAAGAWSGFYVGVALAFGVVLGVLSGWDLGTQYFAGYVVEKSLSIDNLFVFVVIVGAFAVPPGQQSRALTIGITMALLMRAVFIALGAALLDAFAFMFAVFGVGLLFSAVQLVRHRDEELAVRDGRLVTTVRRVLPVSDEYAGSRITTRVDGRRALTPLALVLVALAGTDVLFALDSIPAVYGVTDHPYIVFCANAFALLGLRALFFLVSGLLERLVYLAFGLSLVLAFIGVKLILEFVRHEVSGVPVISTGASLVVILVVLTVTAVASLLRTRAPGGPAASSDAEGEIEVAHADADELARSVDERQWTAGRQRERAASH